MITWSWQQEMSADELVEVEELLASAASYDEEAGFSTAVPGAPQVGEVRHLLVTMPPRGSRGSADLDRLPDVRVVAYLRLDLADAVGTVQLVVRPEFRSLGVATLLFERLDSEAGGWAAVPGLARLAAWSHGEHPAANRMRMRFGGRVEQAVFKTLRPVGGNRPFRSTVAEVLTSPAAGDVPELVRGHHTAMNPADATVLARAATEISVPGSPGNLVAGVDPERPAERLAALALVRAPGAGRDDLTVLLEQGLRVLQDDGARMVQCHVDALDDLVVSVSRELGFVHDQSDLYYVRDLSA